MTHLKSSILILALALGLAGCSAADRDAAVVGGAIGAVAGGVGTGTAKGAAAGAAIGAGAGVLIGRVFGTRNDCYYRDRRGRRYISRCR